MRFVAAYALAIISGNTSPSVRDVTEILESVSREAVDVNRVEEVVNAMKGKNLAQVITERLGSFASASTAPVKVEAPEEEEDEDKEVMGNMDLFS
jgi:ribosomal protein L12E/L44/L45/RPP1/RPP2